MRDTKRVRRPSRLLIGLAILSLLQVASPALAGHDASEHSANIRLLAQEPIRASLPSLSTMSNNAAGSDLAFQGNLLVAGAYEGIGFFKILKEQPYLRQVSFYQCPGAQADVSVWGDYVFLSIENSSGIYSATANNGLGPGCNDTDASFGQQGIRIIDISDLENPRQVKFVPMLCGSHTHTLMPRGDTMYIYVSSLPNYYADQIPYCSDVTIIEFPRDDPVQAEIVASVNTGINYGCHDITIFMPRKLALGACWKRSQVWDVSDPLKPKVLADITNEWEEGHHSAAFTWDGRLVAIGHEQGPCRPDSTVGGMAFYDITNPSKPRRVGSYALPRTPESTFCWTHNFGTVPLRNSRRYVAAAGYYAGGLSVVDFSDPDRPHEVAYYVPIEDGSEPTTWGAYWYNGRIYTNDWVTGRGVGVFQVDRLGKQTTRYFGDRFNPQLQLNDS